MQSLFPAEANAYLEIDELTAPGISFFVAELSGKTIGTAALARKSSYAEIKSMFVAPEARGSGAAAALMQALETEAISQKIPQLKLETGIGLDAAHHLYKTHGFHACPPFGDYTANPYSLFFEKPLPPSSF